MENSVIPQSHNLFSEIEFTTSRSGGPGGQNVNKVSTKVTLRFDVVHSRLLNDEQKQLILHKLAAKTTKDGMLMIVCQEKRTQLENKREAVAKFDQLMLQAFTMQKKRKPSKPSKSSIKKRINDKKQRSDTKRMRQRPD